MLKIFTLRIFCFNLHIMNFYKKAAILSTIVLSTGAAAQNKAEVITEKSPSRAEYFSWINNCYRIFKN